MLRIVWLYFEKFEKLDGGWYEMFLLIVMLSLWGLFWFFIWLSVISLRMYLIYKWVKGICVDSCFVYSEVDVVDSEFFVG